MDEPTDTHWVVDPYGVAWTKMVSGSQPWACGGSHLEWAELDEHYGDLTPLYPAPERPDDVPDWALHSDHWTWSRKDGSWRSRSTLRDVPDEDQYPGPPEPEPRTYHGLTEAEVRERAGFARQMDGWAISAAARDAFRAKVAEWDAEDAAKEHR